MTLAPLLYRASPVQHLPSAPVPQSRNELDRYSSSTSYESRATSPLPLPSVSATDISRPSSASTQASNVVILPAHHHGSKNICTPPYSASTFSLPALSTLASIASAPSSQLSHAPFINHATPSINYTNASPAPASLAGNASPVCQNCHTSTTPLWRRDELGSVLCNACGLFLKLHGRSRPISLKTDTIKSRNRVRSSAPTVRKKVSSESSGLAVSTTDVPRSSKTTRQHETESLEPCHTASEQSQSSSGRAFTPNGHNDANIAPPHVFDAAASAGNVDRTAITAVSHVPDYPSPNVSVCAANRDLERPQSYEQLLSSNSQLKTRVNELELINMMRLESENRLQRELERSRANEDDLKRRIDQLEAAHGSDLESSQRPSKRHRCSDQGDAQ